MTRRITFFALCILVLWGGNQFFAQQPPAGDLNKRPNWKRVNDAINKGLPKTAIKELQPIIDSATKNGRHAEAVRAIGMKITMESTIQGNKPNERITRLEKELDGAAAEIKPLLKVLLANWYWHHFQQNRWRFQQRTQSSGDLGDDIDSWDLPRILKKIDGVFQDALSHADELKKIPVDQYDDLLDRGNVSDNYRPTLYDVVAHNALNFYSAGEQGTIRSRDFFQPTAEGPILSDTAAMLAWKPNTTDTDSPIFKAITLYQNVLKFHENDENKLAIADADLARVVYGNAVAVGGDKKDRYRAALERLIERYASIEVSALARHHLALSYNGDSEFVRAREIAQMGFTTFPGSVGGRRCKNLINQIESKQLSISTERVWNHKDTEITINYRNLSRVHFRLLRFDAVAYLASQRYQPEQHNYQEYDRLLQQPIVKSWSVDIPPTDDFKPRSELVRAPQGVPKGSYLLVSSSDGNFNRGTNQLSIAEVWVSDLSLLVRTERSLSSLQGLVLNAESGAPIVGASIDVWQQERNNHRRKTQTVTTDREGQFVVPGMDQKSALLHVRHRDDAVTSSRLFRVRKYNPKNADDVTRFFTDRAIYRPGQTIHFKGICHTYDHRTDKYSTLPNLGVTVGLFDPNNEKVEELRLRSNAYGSFSGSFTAPANRVTGQMYVRVISGPKGQTNLSVEQYKRPKFKTEVEKPEVAAKLNGEVTLVAKASAYSGAPIDDAVVSWRVVRNVQYPGWWYWRCWWMPPQKNSQEIDQGSGAVNEDGTFEIKFVAKPDPSVLRESEPIFRYTVYADITDATGETRSASRTVSVGYTALSASISTPSWLTNTKPVKLAIQTSTLDGVGQAATGEVKIHLVEQPDQVARPRLTNPQHRRTEVDEPDQPDPSKPQSWRMGEVVQSFTFESNAAGSTSIETKNLEPGIYRAMLSTQDRFGNPVTAQIQFQVLDPKADKLNEKLTEIFVVETPSVQPGDEFRALWGTGYEKAQVLIEVEHRGKLLQKLWTQPNQTQVLIRQKVNEEMRGGFTVRTTMVRENRSYVRTHNVGVPWTNKQLSLRWEHFVSKLEPGSKETWSAVISGPEKDKIAAELVATLYDASLDAYRNHYWQHSFNVFRSSYSYMRTESANIQKYMQQLHYGWNPGYLNGNLTYRHFPPTLMQNYWGFNMPRSRRSFGARDSFGLDAPMEGANLMMDKSASLGAAMGGGGLGTPMAAEAKSKDAKQLAQKAGPNLNEVAVRKNLNETAFFFPHLSADQSGNVKLEFTMPEALTEWKFIAFAHDTELRSGLLSSKTVTQKDIMVEPNPPRFVREGDALEFTVKVSNLSATRQTGSVRLSFLNARTEQPVDDQIANKSGDKDFSIPANQSETFSWRIEIPDGAEWMIYRAVASTGTLSDGQQDFLPVLSRRVLVTESISLPIRDAETKRFEFSALKESSKSDSLEHQSLTVQMASNPSWYAVMALPYLMEYPHQCNEQTFNRLYANSLASHIAMSDPKINRVFDQWRGTKTLDSPMEQNEDLKSVMLQETPWLRQGKNESQARRNVAILFDTNRLASEQKRQHKKLSDAQLPSGAWSWFPGGRGNEYITLYITTGFGRLRHLSVPVDVAPAIKAIGYLDQKMTERYNKIPADRRHLNHLTTHVALYLYARSFFMKDRVVNPNHKAAFEYWKSQAQKYWLDLAHRQSQAHIAVALKRLGDRTTPGGIMASIKERSVTDDELGMFWRDLELSWWWYRAPIETQAMMIEAFDEVVGDEESVKACKVWLLKQKQTQDWKTTKATADAVYALLIRGTDLLASTELVSVSLAGKKVEPAKVEAGTGFYQKKIAGAEVSENHGAITATKVDEGVAWGSVHWQYFEDVGKVKSHVEGPLTLTKQYFIKKNTNDGPTLDPIDGPVGVGDQLVARIVLKTDRDMEYVHLKDHRGSGTEPVNVLSKYRYQDGLAYYESTQDTASHFFIDYLPKGTYVFEYSVRVQHRGKYQTGLANIQCMYAPEFNSHSESITLEVR